jgi:hypothetical protein
MGLVPLNPNSSGSASGEERRERIRKLLERQDTVPMNLDLPKYEMTTPHIDRSLLLTYLLDEFRSDCSAGFVPKRALIVLVGLLSSAGILNVSVQDGRLYIFLEGDERSLCVQKLMQSTDTAEAVLFRQSLFSLGQSASIYRKPLHPSNQSTTTALHILSLSHDQECIIHLNDPNSSAEEVELATTTSGLNAITFYNFVQNAQQFAVGLCVPLALTVKLDSERVYSILSGAYMQALPFPVRTNHPNMGVFENPIPTGLTELYSKGWKRHALLTQYENNLDRPSILHIPYDIYSLCLPIEPIGVPMNWVPQTGLILSYLPEHGIDSGSVLTDEVVTLWRERVEELK